MIEKAKAMLSDTIRCAVIKGDEVFTSDKNGIAPLLQLYDSGKDYNGCVAADKIVGKAAAFIYVLLGAREIYGCVMSEAAMTVLDEHGIKYGYSQSTTLIRNREKTAMCPMERAVENISDPHEAVLRLKETVALLAAKR